MSKEYELYVARETLREKMKKNNAIFFEQHPGEKINTSKEYMAMKEELYKLDIEYMNLKEEETNGR